MKVYIKIHHFQFHETVACCDEQLLNKSFSEGDFNLDITDQFFGGNLVNIEKAIEILKTSDSFNIVGENITSNAVKNKIVSKEGIQLINNLPIALKMMF